MPRSVPDVAALDIFFQRYGWDFWTYQEQPQWLIQELSQMFRAEAVHKMAVRKKQENAASGRRVLRDEVPQSHDDLMRVAAQEGFLQYEPPEA